MAVSISLEKIDMLRERTGLSYREANRLLEENQGDMVEALIAFEEEYGETPWRERIHVTGHDLAGKIRELVHQGNVTRIHVKQGDNTILQLPVTLGAVGTVLAPWLAAAGVVGALVTRCTIEVERRGDPQGPLGTTEAENSIETIDEVDNEV